MYKKRLPTDQDVFEYIYKNYFDDFVMNDWNKNRSTKIYVPINCKQIADYFKTDGDIVFGRLYYYLNNRYSYINDENSKVYLFALKVGQDFHCINFPLLTSILSSMRRENKILKVNIVLTIISLMIAICSLARTF